MTRFACNDNHLSQAVDRQPSLPQTHKLLLRNNMRLETPLHPFSDLQVLVDAHSAAFGISFGSLFEKVKSTYKENRKTENPSKLGTFVLRNKHMVLQIAQSKNLSFLNALLYLISEIQNLKIKLFEVCGSRLTMQRFGTGSKTCLYVFRSEHCFSLLTPLNNSFEEDICCGSLSNRKTSMSNADAVTQNVDVHSEKRSKERIEEKSTDIEFVKKTKNGVSNSATTPMDLSLTSENSSISIKSVLSSRANRQQDTHSSNISTHNLKTNVPSPTVSSLSDSRQLTRSHTGGYSNNLPVKPAVENHQIYYEGKIKFYSDQNQYGFISANGEDTFVHRDDLVRACIDVDRLTSLLKYYELHVKFRSANYQARGKVARKAVDVTLVDFVPQIRP